MPSEVFDIPTGVSAIRSSCCFPLPHAIVGGRDLFPFVFLQIFHCRCSGVLDRRTFVFYLLVLYFCVGSYVCGCCDSQWVFRVFSCQVFLLDFTTWGSGFPSLKYVLTILGPWLVVTSCLIFGEVYCRYSVLIVGVGGACACFRGWNKPCGML